MEGSEASFATRKCRRNDIGETRRPGGGEDVRHSRKGMSRGSREPQPLLIARVENPRSGEKEGRRRDNMTLSWQSRSYGRAILGSKTSDDTRG